VTHYSALATKWLDWQAAKVGQTWHVDERVVNGNGKHSYPRNVMDSETRFLLASEVSQGRGVPEARAALRKAKRATEKRPTEIRSDGLSAYPEAIKREFKRRRLASDPVRNLKQANSSYFSPHVVVPRIRARKSNNILERLNGTSKDRTKVMRAYDNDDGAAALSEGWRVHYNAVRTHPAIGTTPALMAHLPDLGAFRWKTLIDLAARRNVISGPETSESSE
jgi:transposase-like protein